MKSFQLRLAGVFVVLLCLAAPYFAMAGQTYYVSPQGSNANPGSINAPWRSLEVAVSRAKAGDTIIMRGGTYTVGEVFIDRNKGRGGAPGQYLTIKAFQGEQPVLQPGSRRLIIWADYVRVEGLHLVMPWRCDAFGIGLQIINNKFTGPQPKFGAIETGGSNILIENNFIQLSSNGNTRDHGIYVHAGNGIVVRGNTIIGSEGYGIHVFDQNSGASLTNYTIEGNLIIGSKLRAGIIVAKQGEVTINNITIQKNISVNNAWYGLFLRDGNNIKVLNNTFNDNELQEIKINSATNIEVKNNILSKMTASTLSKAFVSVNSIEVNNNLYFNVEAPISDSNPIFGNPLFVDLANHNYSLQENSPAIDVGINVGLPFAGSAPDLGAFEFGLPTSVENPGIQPEQFSVHQNYPNPFNPETNIVYEVDATAKITIHIYDMLGRQVRTLVNTQKGPGSYVVLWDGRNDSGKSVASGVYFYKFQALSKNAPVFSETKRMILLR